MKSIQKSSTLRHRSIHFGKYIALAVFLLVVGVGIYVAAQTIQAEEKDSTKAISAESLERSQAIAQVQVTATDYFEKGDIDGGFVYYDEQIARRQDSVEKQTLLILKSSFAIRSGRTKEAVAIAKQADDIGSTTSTIRTLADAYRADGDKEQALIYYKQLLEKSQKNDTDMPKTQRGPSIEGIIKELEQ